MSQVRALNIIKRNERLRAAFHKGWTNAPRARIHSREHIKAQLAEEFCLSVATGKGILWTNPEETKAEQAIHLRLNSTAKILSK